MIPDYILLMSALQSNLGTTVITSGKEDIFLLCILVMFAHWHDLLLLYMGRKELFDALSDLPT